jgi:hypothetical protein
MEAFAMKTLVLAVVIFTLPQPAPRTIIVVPPPAPTLTSPLPANPTPQTDGSRNFDIRPDFQGYMKVIPAPDPGARDSIVLRSEDPPIILRGEAPAPKSGPFRFMPLERDKDRVGPRT